MEKHITACYLDAIQKRQVPEDYDTRIVKPIWNTVTKTHLASSINSDSVFCCAYGIVTEYMTRILKSERTLDKQALANAVVYLAEVIIGHQYEITRRVGKRLKRDAKTVFHLLDGNLYLPSLLDVYDLLQNEYQLVPCQFNQISRRLISVFVGSCSEIAVDPLASILGIVQLLEDITVDDSNTWQYSAVYGSVSMSIVDDVYGAICASPIFCILTDNIKNALLNYAPIDDTVSINELSPTIIQTPQHFVGSLHKSCGIMPLSIDHSIEPKQIGKGGYGTVCVVTTSKNIQIAYKKQYYLENYIKEVVYMRALDHPNIAKVLSIDVSNMAFSMRLESLDLGRVIARYIGTNKLSNEVTRRMVEELLCAVTYIHGCGIIHGDLNPQNILVSPSWSLVIADFGGSMGLVGVKKKLLPANYITISHRPLELLLVDASTTVEYGFEVDVWSCGVIIAQLQGKEPFDIRSIKDDPKRFIQSVIDNDLDGSVKLTATMDADIGLIVRQCLSKPDVRPTAAQCLAMQD